MKISIILVLIFYYISGIVAPIPHYRHLHLHQTYSSNKITKTDYEELGKMLKHVWKTLAKSAKSLLSVFSTSSKSTDAKFKPRPASFFLHDHYLRAIRRRHLRSKLNSKVKKKLKKHTRNHTIRIFIK